MNTSCLLSKHSIQLNSSHPTSKEANIQFVWDMSTAINYSLLNLVDEAGTILCYLNILDSGPKGICVKEFDGEFYLTTQEPFTNRIVEVTVPIAINDPKFKLILDGNIFYIIGIDDIRGNYGQEYYKFNLFFNSVAQGGVNIWLNTTTGRLHIQGGYPD